MRFDPTLSTTKHDEVRDLVARRLEPGESALAVFTVMRFRRSLSYLVVTDRRLLTLGLEYQGYPVMDDVPHSCAEGVVVERQSMWRFGEVRAQLGQDDATYLGTLDTGQSGAALDLFEEVVETARSGPGAMRPISTPRPPVLPGPARPAAPRDEVPEDLPLGGGPTRDGAGDAPAGRYLPLVDQLAELGRLHQAGLLTADEFAIAKAHVLEQAAPSGESSEE